MGLRPRGAHNNRAHGVRRLPRVRHRVRQSQTSLRSRAGQPQAVSTEVDTSVSRVLMSAVEPPYVDDEISVIDRAASFSACDTSGLSGLLDSIDRPWANWTKLRWMRVAAAIRAAVSS